MNEKSFFLLVWLLSKQVSDGFVLRDAMINAGLLTHGPDIVKNIGFQTGVIGVESAIANQVAAQATGGQINSDLPLFPLVLKYLSGASSTEECVLRSSLVVIVYGAAGVLNFISVEAATTVSPAIVIFANFMASQCSIILLPAHYSFGKKLICTLLISGSGFRLIKKTPIKTCFRYSKKAFIKSVKLGSGISCKVVQKLKRKSKFKINQTNYLKIVFLGFGLLD